MAVAVMDIARYEFGLSVPDDLSIVGYDDVGPARWPSYGITSVTQPIMPMVEATVDILMDQIASGEIEPQHKVIPGELIVRTSARVPKKGIFERDGVKFYKPGGTH
jgi:DNA-binding LacI/PurR family transcriptional regulator